MVRKVLLVLVLLIGAFIGFAALQPKTYSVTRTATVDAPPSVVYDQLVDFRAWRAWSPWDERDPDMERTHGGPPSGVGATYSWSGDETVGRGNMAITEAEPGREVVIALRFEEPFPSENQTRFSLEKKPEGRTKVTWTMTGDKGGLVGQALGIFVDFDQMIGADFEEGLAKLDQVSQAKAREAAKAATEDVPPAGETGTGEGDAQSEAADEGGAEVED